MILGRADRCVTDGTGPTVPGVLADPDPKLAGELHVAPNKTPDFVQAVRSHGKPDLERPELASEGNLATRQERRWVMTAGTISTHQIETFS